MQSRVVQLLTRLVAYALVAIAALLFPSISDDQKAEVASYAPAIAAAIGAALVALADLLIHRFQNGGVFRSAGNGGAMSPALRARVHAERPRARG